MKKIILLQLFLIINIFTIANYKKNLLLYKFIFHSVYKPYLREIKRINNKFVKDFQSNQAIINRIKNKESQEKTELEEICLKYILDRAKLDKQANLPIKNLRKNK